jgi:hypothetical protein
MKRPRSGQQRGQQVEQKIRDLLDHIPYVKDVDKMRKLATRTQEAVGLMRFITPQRIFTLMSTNYIITNSSVIFLISSKDRPTPLSPAQHESRERIQQNKVKRF